MIKIYTLIVVSTLLIGCGTAPTTETKKLRPRVHPVRLAYSGPVAIKTSMHGKVVTLNPDKPYESRPAPSATGWAP